MTDKTKEPGSVHRQTARKPHDCNECADPILKGQSYIYLNTFDERSRRWSKYLLCAECERILNCHRVVEIAITDSLPYDAGCLRIESKRLFHSSPEYKREFTAAWKASRPVAVSETKENA